MRNHISMLFISMTFFCPPVFGAISGEAYQCELLRDVGTSIDSICSGTFLSPTLFLTAGHCFDILDAGPARNAKRKYSVKCADQPLRAVLAVAPHPYLYSNSRFKFEPEMVGEINPESSNAYAKIAYNDMALLVTEPNSLTNFPSLPSIGQAIHYQRNSCRMFGFGTGMKHYRDNLSLDIGRADSLSDNFCDMNSGKQCYLATEWGEITNAERPLMLAMSIIGEKYPSIDHGDSGAGLLCKDATGKEVLAGLITNGSSLNTVNVVNKMGFISHFLALTPAEAIEQSMTFKIEPNFREILVHLQSINSSLKVFFPELSFPPSIVRVDSSYETILIALDKWVIENPVIAQKLFSKIALIVPANDPNIYWGSRFWKSNVNLRDGVVGYPRKNLEFNAHASIGEIVEALKKLQN